MKKILYVAIIFIFSFSLFACSSFDPIQAIDGSLKLYTTGEVSEELIESTGKTKETLEKEYEETYEKMIDKGFDLIDVDVYTKEVGEKSVKNYIDACLSSIKYEISDEYTESDDTYYVDVKIYPITWTQSAESYVTKDFVNEWANKIKSGDYKFTTKSQFTIDMYNDLFNKLAEKAKNTEYGEPETMEIRVEFDGEYYVINETDMERFIYKAFPV